MDEINLGTRVARLTITYDTITYDTITYEGINPSRSFINVLRT